jgi:hypothetical protein
VWLASGSCMVWTLGKDGRQQGEYARELEFYLLQQWLCAVYAFFAGECFEFALHSAASCSAPTLALLDFSACAALRKALASPGVGGRSAACVSRAGESSR